MESMNTFLNALGTNALQTSAIRTFLHFLFKLLKALGYLMKLYDPSIGPKPCIDNLRPSFHSLCHI